MRNVILVFGSGRSGTSWLAETMARPRGYRLLFEPEHETHIPQGKVLTDRMLLPDGSYPDVDKFLKKLFHNRIDNDWIAQHSYRKYKVHLWPFLVRKIIVKFVRCNLGMHYMARRFKVPVVYIRRDPYTTLHSQHRVGFPWLYDLSKFREQQELVNLVSKIAGAELLGKELSQLQNLALRWALENLLPFHSSFTDPSVKNVILLDYHKLKGNSNAYLQLLERLQLQAPENLKSQLERPSSKTHPRSTIHGGNEPDIALFTAREKSEIDGILKLFGHSEVSHLV
jgi:hypothetical protein